MPAGIIVDGISFTEVALVDRPEHAAILGRTFTSWSLLESSITALLGLMMHGDYRAALAVLGSFSNNSSRVEAVRRIGKEILDASVRDSFDALMKEVLSYARERNAIAHSLWGSHPDKPEVVYRMPMTAIPTGMVDLPGRTDFDADAFAKSLRDGIIALSVADLEQTEQKGRELLSRVMRETAGRAYSRTLESGSGKGAR